MIMNDKVEWDGTGLPPVGCECEYETGIYELTNVGGGTFKALNGQTVWSVKVVLVHGKRVAVILSHNDNLFLISDTDKLRPIRSEADKKRDAAKHAIAELCRSSASNGHSAELIYDAIAAGKIPGVRIE